VGRARPTISIGICQAIYYVPVFLWGAWPRPRSALPDKGYAMPKRRHADGNYRIIFDRKADYGVILPFIITLQYLPRVGLSEVPPDQSTCPTESFDNMLSV
jgi:hypothetical protein